jgi:cytosine/uracil/thiamine/allantoin permease
MTEELLDLPDAPLNPPPKVPLGKIALINFVVLLAYIGLFDSDKYLVLHAFAIVIQFFLNFLVGLILLLTKHKHIGRAMLLSSFLVLIVGFGLCIGKAELIN